ncbi:MAG: transcriptional repressor [Bacteroidetes bacterium]|uniref:Transcriptional repressor n=1 Tax=Candidatus Cryptobacteroides excrementavium TaxID=2840759 RepID=A0A9D9NS23_9BACT|nr:transcriptional repressor [Candidatus Cryptobacteroides excrementavium]
MDSQRSIEVLEKKGVRVTAIRILVMEALLASSRPMSLSDLETVLDTVDKSSIFRTLEVFEKHHAVHSIDDGTGSIKFEVCEGGTDCTVSDMHTHFYCEKCHRTYCLKDINVPVVNLPEGFEMHSVNYIVKGICPGCR